MKVAVILACFNRKEKTVSCLESLFVSRDKYNETMSNNIVLSVFLTDDGCTDGTVDAIRRFASEDITILHGDGNLFWAGGMRLAWNKALKKHEDWDYYLLVNDDTVMFENMFLELLFSQEYCKKNFGKDGLISGVCCSKLDHTFITYSGDVWVNKFLGTQKRLKACGIPQKCDMTNANILLVPKYVVDTIGVFDKAYIHGAADYDYTIRANKSHIPVLISGNVCGSCDNDHLSYSERAQKIISMTLRERRLYFNFPPRSGKDHAIWVRKHTPVRYPMVLVGRLLELYCPKIYFGLSNVRMKDKIHKKDR